MRFILLFFSIFLYISTCIAQDIEITPNSEESTDHYLSYSDALILRFYGINKFTEIDFEDKEQEDNSLYKANDNFNLGFGFNYKWAGLNLAFNFPFMNKDDKIYGETIAFDLQANLYGRKNLIDINFQSYVGYYWKNPENFIPNFDPNLNGYPTRRDLSTVNLSGSMLHIFNHEEFSYRAAFVQNERQLHSAGSWLLGGYFSAFGIQTLDSTFILPREFITRVKNSSLHVKELNSTHLGLLGGYAHTFVIRKKWFASLSFTVGLGFKSIERILPNGTRSKYNNGGGYASGRFAFGHNNDRTFYGITSVANNLNMELEKTMDVSYNFGAIRFIYARRITGK